MTATVPDSHRWQKRSGLIIAAVIGLALVVRLVLALLVQGYVDRKGTLCVFGDTAIYWQLAGQIEHGQTYQVDQMGQPHYALRTPGYPLFLAACRQIFGDRMLPVRVVQAVLNALAILFLVSLSRLSLGKESGNVNWSIGIIAAAFAALDPYAAGMSILALSEGLFFPLMLLGLVGVARLWPPLDQPEPSRPVFWSVVTGLVMGLAIQARPSWALFVPLLLLLWVVGSSRERRGSAVRWASVVALMVAIVMAPWWIRNARLFGRFVPTALWVGASLYDGLNPRADGSSDMRFLEAPEIARLDEEAQDAELRRQSVAFVKSEPARALWLAVVKAGRYFSPWPNAENLRSPIASVVSAAWTIPLFLLTVLGVWETRRDARALVLLLGPLIYFMLLHMVFVSSIRYRIPGMLPAFVLTAKGLGRVGELVRRREHART